MRKIDIIVDDSVYSANNITDDIVQILGKAGYKVVAAISHGKVDMWLKPPDVIPPPMTTHTQATVLPDTWIKFGEAYTEPPKPVAPPPPVFMPPPPPPPPPPPAPPPPPTPPAEARQPAPVPASELRTPSEQPPVGPILDRDIVLTSTKYKGQTLGWVKDNQPEYFSMMASYAVSPEIKEAVRRMKGEGGSKPATPTVVETPRAMASPPPPPPAPSTFQTDASPFSDDAGAKKQLINEISGMISGCKKLQGPGLMDMLVPWLQTLPEIGSSLDYTVLNTSQLKSFKDKLGVQIAKWDPPPVFIPPMPTAIGV